MALIYQSEIRPSKLELVQQWIAAQPWFDGDPAALSAHAAFRFDDPEGEVGVESLLLGSGPDGIVHVVLTYRGAPLAGAEAHLVGEMEHSVLGHRWVYDGLGDPACLAAFATAAATGGRQAELVIDGQSERRRPTALVSGSGTGTDAVPAAALMSPTVTVEGRDSVATAGGIRVVLHRYPVAEPASDTGRGAADRGDVITGTWHGQAAPALLAEVTAA
jgi:hypothetical protein